MTSVPSLNSTAVTRDLLVGALDVETTPRGFFPCRLPGWAREQADPQLLTARGQPSGTRLAFRTQATVVELDTHSTMLAFRGMPPRPAGSFDLVIDGSVVGRAESHHGTVIAIDVATGLSHLEEGPTQTHSVREPPR